VRCGVADEQDREQEGEDRDHRAGDDECGAPLSRRACSTITAALSTSDTARVRSRSWRERRAPRSPVCLRSFDSAGRSR
jgi:hypothetical protein